MAGSDVAALPDGALDDIASRVGTSLRGAHDGTGLRIGIGCALFNGGVTMRLLDGALEGLHDAGTDRRDITVAWAPGAFELPLVARAFAHAGKVDAVLCLGAVIRGDTGHYDFVAGECASGIQQVQLATGVPVIFGILTCDTLEQAIDRAGLKGGNKGFDAGLGAVEMAELMRKLRAPSKKPAVEKRRGT